MGVKRLYPTASRLRFEPKPYCALVQHANHSATEPPIYNGRHYKYNKLAQPSTSSTLRITDRSFQSASSRLWNQLPASLRQPRTNLSISDSPSVISGTYSICSIDSPLSSFITPTLSFQAETFLFCKSFPRNLPFLLQNQLHGFSGLFIYTSEHVRFLLFCFSIFHFLVFGSVW